MSRFLWIEVSSGCEVSSESEVSSEFLSVRFFFLT